MQQVRTAQDPRAGASERELARAALQSPIGGSARRAARLPAPRVRDGTPRAGRYLGLARKNMAKPDPKFRCVRLRSGIRLAIVQS